LITKRKHITVEIGSPCKVAVVIYVTYWTAIQIFIFCVLLHLNRYNYNLHFYIVGAILLTCTTVEYIAECLGNYFVAQRITRPNCELIIQ
jgi:hypothetical protein